MTIGESKALNAWCKDLTCWNLRRICHTASPLPYDQINQKWEHDECNRLDLQVKSGEISLLTVKIRLNMWRLLIQLWSLLVLSLLHHSMKDVLRGASREMWMEGCFRRMVWPSISTQCATASMKNMDANEDLYIIIYIYVYGTYNIDS